MPPDRPWAVVLGTSSGVGAAVARAITARGEFDLFGMHRGNHPETAERLGRHVAAAGARAEIVCGDAATLESATANAGRLREMAGPQCVRLLVHSLADASLGAFVRGPGSPFHPRQFEKTFQTMAHSFVFWAQQLVAHDLLAPGASLVALTNPFVDQLCGGFGLVTAAKAALEVYVRHLALELGPLGVRVNAVKFGLVETVAVRRAFADEAWAQAVARVSAATPYGRIATAEEVAEFLTLLVRRESAWLNGATIDLTGGQVQSLLHYLFHHR
jgi:NAD(P)-dependent dehydrogenase (short-subunit alcohol dehydrogenase family)